MYKAVACCERHPWIIHVVYDSIWLNIITEGSRLPQNCYGSDIKSKTTAFARSLSLFLSSLPLINLSYSHRVLLPLDYAISHFPHSPYLFQWLLSRFVPHFAHFFRVESCVLQSEVADVLGFEERNVGFALSEAALAEKQGACNVENILMHLVKLISIPKSS